MEIFGYEFKDETLLKVALTTPAYRMSHPFAQDNQRLEFLGDAVLGLLSAERVFTEFPKEPEGSLTVRRTHMVSAAALCEAANRFGIADRLRRNKGAAALPGDSKTLADAMEAIIGAAYLDGGFVAAQQVFGALQLTANARSDEWSENPKGALQVRSQALKPPRHPVYEVLRIAGKAHEPAFTVRVTVEGFGSAVATASSHKKAEALAASSLLRSLDGTAP